MQVRLMELARAGWGAALLLSPRLVLESVHEVEVDSRSLLVARILGVRHLTQAALSGVNPGSDVLALGIWVDLAHGSTAVALAAVDRTRVRAGLIDAVTAGLWAQAGYRGLRNVHERPTAGDRSRDVFARRALARLPGGAALARIADRDRRRPPGR